MRNDEQKEKDMNSSSIPAPIFITVMISLLYEIETIVSNIINLQRSLSITSKITNIVYPLNLRNTDITIIADPNNALPYIFVY